MRHVDPRGVAAAILGAGLLVIPPSTSAHEIPPRVSVFAFVKPEGNTLRVLVRVPLESIRDIQFPLRGPGYLDLGQIQPVLGDAAKLWIADYLEFYEGDRRLEIVQVSAARISLPSDRSFESFDSALVNITGPPLPDATDLIWQQAMLDVLFEYPITSDRARFAVNAELAHLGLRTSTVLRFLPAGSSERVFQYTGNPGRVTLDPRWHQAAFRFVTLGFTHILDGIDHLLFVFCLLIPFRKLRPLVVIVTSFTVAHSITLIASATGLAPDALWFPPLIEMLIALSIVYMAVENIVGPQLERRWVIAFCFGLVHGFGFSFLLRDSLQFAGGHLATSLLMFNAGVELGQILVLLLSIPLLDWLFKRVVAERIGTILLSALIAHTAWHWMMERGSAFLEYEIRWPAFDLALALGAARIALLLGMLAGAIWLLYGLVGRVMGPQRHGTAAPGPEGQGSD